MATVSTLGVLLALAASFGFTCFDAVRKGLSRHAAPEHMGVWLCIGHAPLLAVWAAFNAPPDLPRACWGPFGLSTLLNLVALLWFLQALQRSPMSLTIPLLSFTPVGATLLNWLLRGTVPTIYQSAGALLVVSGALALGWPTKAWPGLRAFLREPGVPRMAGAALVWSLGLVVDQVAVVERGAGVWYAPALSLSVGLALGLALLAGGKGKPLAQSLKDLSVVPVLSVGAVVLGAAALASQLQSLLHAPAGFVETLKRGIGMTGAVVFGHLFFGERATLQKALAVAILTAGVALTLMRS